MWQWGVSLSTANSYESEVSVIRSSKWTYCVSSSDKDHIKHEWKKINILQQGVPLIHIRLFHASCDKQEIMTIWKRQICYRNDNEINQTLAYSIFLPHTNTEKKISRQY